MRQYNCKEKLDPISTTAVILFIITQVCLIKLKINNWLMLLGLRCELS